MLTENILRAYNKTFDNVQFVNIGAHDGITRDPLYEHMVEGNWSGVMVEPIEEAFALLAGNFADHEHIILEKVAIADSAGTMTMWQPDTSQSPDHRWFGRTSTLNKDFADDVHDRLGEDFQYKKVEVETITLAQLLSRNNITELGVCKIDVEGYDMSVVRQIDFQTIRPHILIYEQINIPLAEKLEGISYCEKHGYVAFSGGQKDIIAIAPEVFSQIKNQAGIDGIRLWQRIWVRIWALRLHYDVRNRVTAFFRNLISRNGT